MKIGFSVFHKNTHTKQSTGVWGDEIMARAMCGLFDDDEADIYDREEIKNNKLDICIHTTHQLFHPYRLKEIADKNVLWIQGFSYDGNKVLDIGNLYELCRPHYDLIITSSRVLSKEKNIPFVLPFTGSEPYRKVESSECYDVSFIGNILKPIGTNVQYLKPLADFNYGIFGGDFGKVSHEGALQIISGSKLNLSYGFEEGIKWDMVIARPFYQSLCESFTIMDKVPFYMETFGKTMAFTNGGDEEKELIVYYLENEEMRKKLTKEAFEIAKSIKNENLLKIIKGV